MVAAVGLAILRRPIVRPEQAEREVEPAAPVHGELLVVLRVAGVVTAHDDPAGVAPGAAGLEALDAQGVVVPAAERGVDTLTPLPEGDHQGVVRRADQREIGLACAAAPAGAGFGVPGREHRRRLRPVCRVGRIDRACVYERRVVRAREHVQDALAVGDDAGGGVVVVDRARRGDLHRRAEDSRRLVVGSDERWRARCVGRGDLHPDDIRGGADGRRERGAAGGLDHAKAALAHQRRLGQGEPVALEPRLDHVERHPVGAPARPIGDRTPDGDQRWLAAVVPSDEVFGCGHDVHAAVRRPAWRLERQAHQPPAAACVDRVEQYVAQAPVADADLEDRVETAEGVGLYRLAARAAGVDGGAKARVGAAYGVEDRSAAEGAVPQRERVLRGVLSSPYGCGCRRRLPASKDGRLTFVGRGVAELLPEAQAAVDAQWGVARRSGRRRRQQRRAGEQRCETRDGRSPEGAAAAAAHDPRGGGTAADAPAAGVSGPAMPARQSAVAAKRQVLPASPEMSTMRW